MVDRHEIDTETRLLVDVIHAVLEARSKLNDGGDVTRTQHRADSLCPGQSCSQHSAEEAKLSTIKKDAGDVRQNIVRCLSVIDPDKVHVRIFGSRLASSLRQREANRDHHVIAAFAKEFEIGFIFGRVETLYDCRCRDAKLLSRIDNALPCPLDKTAIVNASSISDYANFVFLGLGDCPVPGESLAETQSDDHSQDNAEKPSHVDLLSFPCQQAL